MASGVGDSARVTARVVPQGQVRRDFGRTLYLTDVSGVIADRDQATLSRTVTAYGSLSDLVAAGPSASVQEAAAVYFQQVPAPGNLLLGNVVKDIQPSYVFGSEAGAVADIEALGNGTALVLGGNAIEVDLDGINTLANFAAAIAVGINAVAAYNGVTCTVSDGTFVVTAASPLDIGVGFEASAASKLLGLSGAGATVLADVPAAETPQVALDRIEGIDCSFFWVVPGPEIVKDSTELTEVRTWVAARPYQYGDIFDVYGTEALVSGENTSVVAVLSSLLGDGIVPFYNGRSVSEIDHKALSYAARWSSTNFSRPNAVPNGKFLDLPGTKPTILTASERDELIRKRVNFYAPAGAGGLLADTAEGTSFGTWVDVFYWLAWFKNALEVASYNILKQTAGAGGIPITDEGFAAIYETLDAVCVQGVLNGGIAPNPVSAATRLDIQRSTSNPDFDGNLTSGYLIHLTPAAEIPQSQRNSRMRIPAKIWLKGSSKVNSLDIFANFEN